MNSISRALLCLTIVASAHGADSIAANRLVGAWKLISYELRLA